MRPPFRFKKFKIEQAQAPHPLGTDAVLLGAWANPGSATRILDIGTGTGILALMMAQKRALQQDIAVHGIEKDYAACSIAQQNFAASPWAGQLFGQCIDIRTYSAKTDLKFDFIISNPPYFFIDSPGAPAASRKSARHMSDLSLGNLLDCVADLLVDNGRFSVIFPPETGQIMMEASTRRGLYFNRFTRVFTKRHKPVERYLLEFSRNPYFESRTDLVLFDENDQRTPEFSHLTADFYQ